MTMTLNQTPPAGRRRRSRAAPVAASPSVLQGPWPTILEQLPEYEPDTLLLALEFYRESVLCRVVDEHGRQSLALVDIAEVARALSAGVSLASGILPGDEAGPNTLFWARSSGSTRVGIWVGPRVWRVVLRSLEVGGKDRRLRLPFPGLLFVCRPDVSGASVFAAPRRPTSLDAPLHHCPAPNVFANGKICPGDHAFARDPLKLPAEFFLSRFRVTGDTKAGKSRTHPDDVSKLWDELSGQATFPGQDLVPMLTVHQAADLTL